MEILTDEQFEALEFAYNQGYIDSLSSENHFGNVMRFWFGLQIPEDRNSEVEDDE